MLFFKQRQNQVTYTTGDVQTVLAGQRKIDQMKEDIHDFLSLMNAQVRKVLRMHGGELFIHLCYAKGKKGQTTEYCVLLREEQYMLLGRYMWKDHRSNRLRWSCWFQKEPKKDLDYRHVQFVYQNLNQVLIQLEKYLENDQLDPFFKAAHINV
ncbi:hypothetical protein ACFL1U_00785 [Patescibacteria group bacterium]